MSWTVDGDGGMTGPWLMSWTVDVDGGDGWSLVDELDIRC